MTVFKDQFSSSSPEEEQPIPDEFGDWDSDQFEWNDCDASVRAEEPDAEEPELQDSTSPPNPFIYGGSRPANLNVAKRKNAVLFGETGVGKSSVINLMAGAKVAKTSPNLEGCTLEATEYTFTLLGEAELCIYDTVGLNESEMNVNTFFGAIEKAYQLIKSLHHAGGVDLLLFCIRGNRITRTTQRNYNLFFEIMCEKKVPLAFVVTNLDYEDMMEDWWERNETTFEKYGIQSVSHACVVATPARSPELAAKRAASRIALQRTLQVVLSVDSTPYVKDVRSWFAHLVDVLWSFLIRNLPASFRRRDLARRIGKLCSLSQDEAQGLADMLTGNR